MTASEIYGPLFSLFDNYEYKLRNSYVYNWESDFFAMSKSGYFLEVEVKVSRSDFLIDFKKPKHLLFQDHIIKKPHHVFRDTGYERGKEREIARYDEKRIDFRYDGREMGYGQRSKNYNWKQDRRNGVWGYWVNDFGDAHVYTVPKTLLAPCTSIRVKRIENIDCPNSFYYATPPGLLKIEELPAYAGLIEVSNGSAKIVRKAPYMHKAKQDLTKILLSKFYNLWRYKVSWKERESISEKDTEQTTTSI